MKKINFILILLAIGACSVWSQTAKEEILADLNKCGAAIMLIQNFPPQTKAPKGINCSAQPLQSAWFTLPLLRTPATRVTDIFNSAHKQHVLTALGEDVYQRLQELMKEAVYVQAISLVGKRQHSDMASVCQYIP